MRTFLATLILAAVASVGLADIHEPPKAKYTKNRKMARAVANLLYSTNEIPATMHRYGERHTEGSVGVFVGGFFHGVQRTGARMMYGFYELWNWQKPLYKDSYRPPYPSIDYLPWEGYEEFPPQIGFMSTNGYTRGRTW